MYKRVYLDVCEHVRHMCTLGVTCGTVEEVCHRLQLVPLLIRVTYVRRRDKAYWDAALFKQELKKQKKKLCFFL